MKFSIQLLAAAHATHYRAGSYEYKPNGSTMQGKTLFFRADFLEYSSQVWKLIELRVLSSSSAYKNDSLLN